MPPGQRSLETAPQSRHSASLRETSASKSKAEVIFPLPPAIEAPPGTAEEGVEACKKAPGRRLAWGEGGQEPGTPCLPLCPLAGAPRHTTEQL